MRTAALSLAFALCLVSALAACGDDDSAAEDETNPHVTTGEVLGLGEEPVDEGDCQGFCEKANECARAQGRPIPPEAADCARGCAPNGVHRQAPEAIYACVSESCGGAFLECSRRAMIEHMRDRDVALFPPVCQGLCEMSAHCNRRANLPPGPGEDDCEAACRAGGSYGQISEREVLCVHQPCGAPFTTCRQEGGPSGPVEVLAPPAMPSPPTSP